MDRRQEKRVGHTSGGLGPRKPSIAGRLRVLVARGQEDTQGLSRPAARRKLRGSVATRLERRRFEPRGD